MGRPLLGMFEMCVCVSTEGPIARAGLFMKVRTELREVTSSAHIFVGQSFFDRTKSNTLYSKAVFWPLKCF